MFHNVHKSMSMPSTAHILILIHIFVFIMKFYVFFASKKSQVFKITEAQGDFLYLKTKFVVIPFHNCIQHAKKQVQDILDMYNYSSTFKGCFHPIDRKAA